MYFQPASTIEKKATITIKSLPAIAPDGRDVYIWEEALNMPAVAPTGGPPAQLQTTVPGHFAAQEPGSRHSRERVTFHRNRESQYPCPNRRHCRACYWPAR